MNELIYDSPKLTLYFSWSLFEFFKQTSISDCTIISFEQLIKEIEAIPDKSEAWKRFTIVHFGKKTEILKELA